MSSVAIRAQGLGKRYLIGAKAEKHDTLGAAIGHSIGNTARRFKRVLEGKAANRSTQHFWALRDLDLEIDHGELVGLIGLNGAGKTTLLKVLSRITRPTRGRAEVHGRVGSLLEVGTGFHPELSGRENVYLNGAILGMSRAEVARKFDAIVDFAELEKFIDTPVKHYSSGMYVRLAFAVAAFVEPEILLVDEVLAVGDYSFQRKCLGKMGDISGEGRTVVLVSHNMEAVRSLMKRTVWIHDGQVKMDGETSKVVSAYLGEVQQNLDVGHGMDLREHFNRARGSGAVLSEVTLRGEEGRDGLFPMGDSLEFRIRFASPKELIDPSLTLALEDEDGRRIYTISTLIAGADVPHRARAGTFVCRLADLPLNQGTYYVMMQLNEGQSRVDRIAPAFTFQVTSRDVYGTGQLAGSEKGYLYWPSQWSFETEVHEEALA